MLGNSTVSTHCKGQAVIALSSGEAEYYGLVSATSQMLGLQSVLLDRGWKFNAHVWVDAAAGIAIGSRRRLGRVKHIDTVFLWVQAMVTGVKISICGLSHEARRCCNDAKLHGWIGYEVPVGRKQADSESVMTSKRRQADGHLERGQS